LRDIELRRSIFLYVAAPISADGMVRTVSDNNADGHESEREKNAAAPEKDRVVTLNCLGVGPGWWSWDEAVRGAAAAVDVWSATTPP
jgi:hypothetical protein